ncbi:MULTISPECIES: DUF3592 domain-containing protein [unclassified Micromonospora]|uniref:DUF3592 domain-containing protein n=1 Tax=unclassified Micromonospora TaxID=2617518 RepID=UPI002FF428B3
MARRRNGWAGRPRRARGTAVRRRVALLLGAGSVVGFLAIAVYDADWDRHLLGSDRTAEATVLTRDSRHVRISFTVDGRQVVTEMEAFSGTEPGDRITVRYHPDDPSRYVMDDRGHLLPFVGSLIALGGAAGLALITLLVWRAPPELWDRWGS